MSEELKISPQDKKLILDRIREADNLQRSVDEALAFLSDNLNTIDRGRRFVSGDVIGLKFSRFQSAAQKLLPVVDAALDRVTELNVALGPARSFFPEAIPAPKKNGEGAEHIDADADAEKAREVIDALGKALAEMESMKKESSIEISADEKVATKLQERLQSANAKPVKRGRGKDELATATEAIKGILGTKKDEQ